MHRTAKTRSTSRYARPERRKYAAAEDDSSRPREAGTVKWFNAAKGYGFITRAGGGDLFIHHSNVDMPGFRTLDEGAAVEFEVVMDAKRGRPEAVNVRTV